MRPLTFGSMINDHILGKCATPMLFDVRAHAQNLAESIVLSFLISLRALPTCLRAFTVVILLSSTAQISIPTVLEDVCSGRCHSLLTEVQPDEGQFVFVF